MGFSQTNSSVEAGERLGALEQKNEIYNFGF